MAKNTGLSNVKVSDFIPKKDYNGLLMASDIGLISLNESFTIPNYPSKVMSYFGAKIPVLASIDLNTDFGQMLTETELGFWAEAGKTRTKRQTTAAIQQPGAKYNGTKRLSPHEI